MDKVLYYEKENIYNIEYQENILMTVILLDSYERHGHSKQYALDDIKENFGSFYLQIVEHLYKYGRNPRFYFDLTDDEYNKWQKRIHNN